MDTRKKARGEGLVNGSISGATPDFSAWDHKPGDPRRVRDGVDPVTREDLRLLDLNQPSEYAKLPADEKDVLQAWLQKTLIPSTLTGELSSYGLKHVFTNSDEGLYVTNGQFKGAMLAAGYEPVDRYELNWMFGYDAVEAERVKRRTTR